MKIAGNSRDSLLNYEIDKSCNIFVTQASLNFKGCLVVNCGDGEVVSKPALECSGDYR